MKRKQFHNSRIQNKQFFRFSVISGNICGELELVTHC